MALMNGAIFIKFGRAPTTEIIFMVVCLIFVSYYIGRVVRLSGGQVVKDSDDLTSHLPVFPSSRPPALPSSRLPVLPSSRPPVFSSSRPIVISSHETNPGH